MIVRRRRVSGRRLLKRRAQAFLLKTIGVFLIVAGVVGVLSFLFSFEPIRIDAIFIEGNSVVTVDELRLFVREKLNGSYFFLFPRESIFLYSRGEIERGVLSAFPKVKTAEVRFEDFQSILLIVSERHPFALWCGEFPASESDICYFLDETGFMYTQAPDFSGDAFFRYYGSLRESSGTEGVLIGSHFLPPPEWNAVVFFLKTLADIGLSISSLTLRDDFDYELSLTDNTRLLVGRGQDLTEVARSIEAAFYSDELIKKRGSLDYIDFRFGNKVYYK